MYGNSPLCPTGHRPFGAAVLLSGDVSNESQKRVSFAFQDQRVLGSKAIEKKS